MFSKLTSQISERDKKKYYDLFYQHLVYIKHSLFISIDVLSVFIILQGWIHELPVGGADTARAECARMALAQAARTKISFDLQICSTHQYILVFGIRLRCALCLILPNASILPQFCNIHIS